MKKASQNPSEEQTLRRNEAKYELEIQKDDKKLTKYAGSIAAHTDEITKIHGQFEIFFPTFVFNPRNMDKDLENVRLLIETEQNNTAKISAQLTTLNQQLKEGKEILESWHLWISWGTRETCARGVVCEKQEIPRFSGAHFVVSNMK